MVENLQFRDWVQEKVIVDGLISIHKPYGIPSTALTEMYKIVTGLKVGHGGTLDPLAEGAMLLGIGHGTKLLTKYLESEKRYRASILIGADSASGDLELPIHLSETDLVYTPEKLQAIFEELAQGFTQELPALNASKQKGKTAYSLVREGKPSEKRFIETRLLDWQLRSQKELISSDLVQLLEIKRKAIDQAFEDFRTIGEQIGYHSRKYEFMQEKWVGSLNQSIKTAGESVHNRYLLLEIEVFVPKGTYIRSLAQDIAARLDTVGMLVELERLSAGNKTAA